MCIFRLSELGARLKWLDLLESILVYICQAWLSKKNLLSWLKMLILLLSTISWLRQSSILLMISAGTFMIWMNAQIWHPSLMISSTLGSFLHKTLDQGSGMHEAQEFVDKSCQLPDMCQSLNSDCIHHVPHHMGLLGGHTTNKGHLDSHYSKLSV